MQILIENQIFPPVSVFCELIKADAILIEKHDNYQKRTYRNRFLIVSPNGKQLLSVPLKKGKNSLKFTDVKISYDDLWLTTLGNTLKTNYGSAPFFHHYFNSIMDIFNKKPIYLFDLNCELRDFVFKCLVIDIPLYFTADYIKFYSDNTRDLRNRFLPVMKDKNEKTLMSYNQVFEVQTGFIPDASVIDLLFNTGKYAVNYLQHYPSK
jgi:hypothetical protein